MEKYIFKESTINDDYMYIFLCGTKFDRNNVNDKRAVLKEFLKRQRQSFIPIILEENFIFKRTKSRCLVYDDIYMKDLYVVEMTMNYMADNNIIINESISTAAETGLFLSESEAIKKTCLLIPDTVAVEENKKGQFLQLAFEKTNPKLETITFFPRLEKNIISNETSNWHTYFYMNQIGAFLGDKILKFLDKQRMAKQIKFSGRKMDISAGYIYFNVKDGKLVISALPRIIMLCVCCLFNINEFEEIIINGNPNKLSTYISIIKEWLIKIFINTIEEKTGQNINECTIQPQLNVTGVYISNIIGMCLYLLQAAGFIEIKKERDYLESGKVTIARKMLIDEKGNRYFFYQKYKDIIKKVIKQQIV